MSHGPAHFELELPATAEAVSCVRTRLLSWLAHRAPVPSRSTGAIALAVSEAVANAARHAYDGPGGAVVVRADLDPERLHVSVQDTGHGFGALHDRASNGLGMTIITRLADEVTLHSDEGGTEVRIGFDLGRADGAGRSDHRSARQARRPQRAQPAASVMR